MKSRPILQFFAVLATAAGLTLNGLAQDKKPAAPPKDKEPAKETTPPKETAAPAAAAGDFSDPSKLTAKAPEKFKAKFETTKGTFVIAVERMYSPNGVDRFYNLVKSGYFKDVVFFRVIAGFMAQFGIHGDPKVSAKWRDANIQDDPVKGSNVRGAICFAKSGAPNSRSTQFFISFGNNTRLDKDGFSAFGKVVEGMDVVDKLNSEYGEGAPQGRGPDQQRVQMEGNAYLKKEFPNLDSIKSATIVE
ncbi:MAG TPA: peptidylprolyl isomerase [Verrucomicrobiales bacterium]|jgi:peptidyl-prolyl cis-trans isomerase A (cyclophilin A)|nr:peptidylprolyl isomerase [Verrucomicrobiales bacterium]